MKRIISMEVFVEDYEDFLKENGVEDEAIEEAKANGTLEDIVYMYLQDIDPFYSYCNVKIVEETY